MAENQNNENVEEVQEGTRCFGEYRCPKCKRRWMSGNSWKGFGQKCRTCVRTYVKPCNLRPLHRPDGLDKSNIKKPHLSMLCQKCQTLGRNCRKIR